MFKSQFSPSSASVMIALFLGFTSTWTVLPVLGQGQCPSACFQGTPENAGPPVADSFCPPAAAIVNPFYTPTCLCYTPVTYDGTPWLFCYTCGSDLSGNFADICGTTPVTQSCPNQQDGISEACKADDDVNSVLGKFCDDGAPSALVKGIGAVVTFFLPELAEGALELIGTGCTEAKVGQTISGAVSQVCNVWQTAGCGTLQADSTGGGSSSSGSGSGSSTSSASSRFAGFKERIYALPVGLASMWALFGY